MSRRYTIVLIMREYPGIGAGGGSGPEGAQQLAAGMNLARVAEQAIKELKVLLVNARLDDPRATQRAKRATKHMEHNDG